MSKKRRMDIKEILERIASAPPKLIEVGRAPPRLVLSFGGAGALVTYSLGVAQFLLEDKKEHLNQWYFLGSGTGVLPAVALPIAVQNKSPDLIRQIMEYIVDNAPPHLMNEDTRRAFVFNGLTKFLPKDAHVTVSGRACLSVMVDPECVVGRVGGELSKNQILYGLPMTSWPSVEALAQVMAGAMSPYRTHPVDYNGVGLIRSSRYSLSTEVDQHIRHVYVHGFGGSMRKSNHSRHAILFGRHGTLLNTSQSPWLQYLTLALPGRRKNALRFAYDAGYNDARRFDRWEEDPYQFAKGDRSAGDDEDWRTLRQKIFNTDAKNQQQ